MNSILTVRRLFGLSMGLWRILALFKLRYNLRLLPFAIVLVTVSCAPNRQLTESQRAIGRTFEAPKNKAVVVVYRPAKPFTGLMGRPVFINKQHVASTSSGSFTAIPLDPGNYSIQAAAIALFETPEASEAYPAINLALVAGQTVFIRQSIGAENPNSSPVTFQAGGTVAPVLTGGGGLPPTKATVVDRSTGRSECSTLKQLGSDPITSTQ